MEKCCGQVMKAIDSKSIIVILVGLSPASIKLVEVLSFILFFNISHVPIISTQTGTVLDTMKQLLLLPTCNNNIVPLTFFATFLLMRQMLDIF